MSYFGVSFKDNEEQQELARLICEKRTQIIFCEGAAGTGKTFATIATVLELIADKKYKRIFYTRAPIEVGDSMGFLPGSVDEKMAPYTMPLYDTLHSISLHSDYHPNENELLHHFEIAPIGFMRGRNIEDDTICIVDEAQNLTFTEIQTLVTRVSKYGKIIFLGSLKQIDNPKENRKEHCDFEIIMNALSDLDFVGTVQLVQSMRSPWCVQVDEILENLKKQH